MCVDNVTTTVAQLEKAALRAHAIGMSWRAFCRRDIRRAVGFDRPRFDGLVSRLPALVTTGNLDGHRPLDAEVPDIDESNKPADVGTAGRAPEELLVPLPPRALGR